MARDSTVMNPSVHIALDLEGATEVDLARGIAAAIAVFEAARVDPWAAAEATHELEWKTTPDSKVSNDQVRLSSVYREAIEAALKAACEYLPNTSKKYNFSLRWHGEPPNSPSPYALEVVYPTTNHGRPPEEVTPRPTARRRKLVGWTWQWE